MSASEEKDLQIDIFMFIIIVHDAELTLHMFSSLSQWSPTHVTCDPSLTNVTRVQQLVTRCCLGLRISLVLYWNCLLLPQ